MAKNFKSSLWAKLSPNLVTLLQKQHKKLLPKFSYKKEFTELAKVNLASYYFLLL